MTRFDHERLDVYQTSISLVAAVHALTSRVARGNADLVDQVRRAAISIPLNIAEGTGEYSTNEKLRFYRIARRSATECAAGLDVLCALNVVTEDDIRYAIELLDRIVAMLTALARHREQSVTRPRPSTHLRPTRDSRPGE